MKSSNRLVHFLLLLKNHFWCVEWIFGNFFQHLKMHIRDRLNRPIRSLYYYLLLYKIKKCIDIGRNRIINDGDRHVFEYETTLLCVTVWHQGDTNMTWFQIDPFVCKQCPVQWPITGIWCWNEWGLSWLLVYSNISTWVEKFSLLDKSDIWKTKPYLPSHRCQHFEGIFESHKRLLLLLRFHFSF